MNSLVLKCDLDDSIKVIQGYDSDIAKIKRYLASGKTSFFHVADDGTMYFKGRLVVPTKRAKLDCIPDVMKEAHDTPLSIHPGSTKMYQDIRQRY